jgi:hypothetical protein
LEARGFEVSEPTYRWFRLNIGQRENFTLIAHRRGTRPAWLDKAE